MAKGPNIPAALHKGDRETVGYLMEQEKAARASDAAVVTNTADITALDTRVTALENATGATFTSADQTITPATALTIAHGLSSTPFKLNAYLIAQGGTEGGYSAGQAVSVNIGVVQYTTVASALRTLGMSIVPDATNLNVMFAEGETSVSPAPVFQLQSLVTAGAFTIGRIFFATSAVWKLRVVATL